WILLAVPAFLPAIIVVAVVLYVALRDRRSGGKPEDAGQRSDAGDGRRGWEGMTMKSMELSFVAEAPARGAGLNQVIGLSIAAVVVTLVMLWVGHAHRSHRIEWLTRIADKLAEKFHRPNWVALPVLVFTTSIICALFGFIWDVSWHIGNGRDPGPLANPAHYFIIIGLFGIFVGGMLSIVLPFDKPGPAAVRITRNWQAPVGGVLMAGCGGCAMRGVPLDEIWYRSF